MVWHLSRAVLRCLWRRAATALGAAPLAGAALVILVVAAPLLLARLGSALGATLAPVVDDDEAARLLALASMLAGAAAGASVSLTSAGRRSLGPQLSAGPIGERGALVASVLVPTGAVVALGLPAVLALGASFGSAISGGGAAGVGLVAVALAAAPAGAVISESVLQGARGAWRGAGASLLLVIAWIATGLLLGTPALGPLSPAAGALSGDVEPTVVLASTALTTCAGVLVWLELATRRPERRVRSALLRQRRVRGPLVAALSLAAALLILRRRDLRLCLLAAVAFGLGGVALASVAGAPAPAPLHLGASSALLGGAIVPLAGAGLLLSGRWTWTCAPRSRLLPCAVVCAVADLIVLMTLVPVVVVAAIVSGLQLTALAQITFVSLLLAGAAQLAGALLPWREGTMGDQLASLGAFVACAGGFSAVTGVAGPRLVAAGLPAPAAAVCLLAVATAIGLGAVALRVERAA
jgi:hypothetical protein